MADTPQRDGRAEGQCKSGGSLGDMTVREFFTKVGHVVGTGAFLGPAIVVAVLVVMAMASYVPLVFEPTDASASESQDPPDLSTIEPTEANAAVGESGDADTSDLGIDTSSLQDGTYTGSGTGFSGTITVQVTVSGGRIADIQVVSSDDTGTWFEDAKGVIQEVLDAQSTSVDVVSGATYSSRGILQAIRNALAQASGGTQEALSPATGSSSAGSASAVSADRTIQSIDTSSLKDGTYMGTGVGYTGNITTQVTISGGRIADIQIASSEDTGSWFEDAKAVVQRILDAQSTNVDTVSGATYSSQGILQAVANALKQAEGTGEGAVETEPADKSALEEEVARAEGLVQDDYTADSWNAYQQALGAAKHVDQSDAATQDEVDAVFDALQSARRALVPLVVNDSTRYADGEYVAYALCGDDDVDFEPYYVALRLTVAEGEVQPIELIDPYEDDAPIFGTNVATEADAVLGDYDDTNDTYLAYAIMGRTRRGVQYTSVVEQARAWLLAHGTAPTQDDVDAVSGATYSSHAIVEAYQSALQQAADAYIAAQTATEETDAEETNG